MYPCVYHDNKIIRILQAYKYKRLVLNAPYKWDFDKLIILYCFDKC